VPSFVCSLRKSCRRIGRKFSGLVYIELTYNWLNFGPPTPVGRGPPKGTKFSTDDRGDIAEKQPNLAQ